MHIDMPKQNNHPPGPMELLTTVVMLSPQLLQVVAMGSLPYSIVMLADVKAWKECKKALTQRSSMCHWWAAESNWQESPEKIEWNHFAKKEYCEVPIEGVHSLSNSILVSYAIAHLNRKTRDDIELKAPMLCFWHHTIALHWKIHFLIHFSSRPWNLFESCNFNILCIF